MTGFLVFWGMLCSPFSNSFRWCVITTGLSPQSTWKWNCRPCEGGEGRGGGAVTAHRHRQPVGGEQRRVLRSDVTHPAGLDTVGGLRTPLGMDSVCVEMRAAPRVASHPESLDMRRRVRMSVDVQGPESGLEFPQ